MTRTLLTLILLLSLSSVVLAQNDVRKFKLLDKNVNNELRLEVNPVGTEDVFVYIYSFEDKRVTNPLKITETFEVNRGKQTLKIDVSGLQQAEYKLEVVQGVPSKRLNRKIKRVVFSENFTKE